jgi:hypothetical protein
MNALVGLLMVVLAGIAMFALFFGLERWLRQPGLGSLLTAVSLVIVAGVGLSHGRRLLPSVFLLSVPMFVYFAHWRRTEARTKSAGAPEA